MPIASSLERGKFIFGHVSKNGITRRNANGLGSANFSNVGGIICTVFTSKVDWSLRRLSAAV